MRVQVFKVCLWMGLVWLAAGLGGCERCVPASGVQLLQEELSGACRLQGNAMTRLTDTRGASTEPSLARMAEGHLVVWREDSEFPPGLMVQKIDALGHSVGQPQRLAEGLSVHRPRVAASAREALVVYTERDAAGASTVQVLVLDSDLRPLLPEPRRLGAIKAGGAAGLTERDGAFLVAVPREDQLVLFEIVVTVSAQSAEPESPSSGTPRRETDSGSPADGRALLAVTERQVALGSTLAPLSSLDLSVQAGRLYVAADSSQGWSIQIAELKDNRLERVVQVIDDRRNPSATWCCPALGPIGDDRLGLLWQGPGMGLSALFFMVFDTEGNALGQERPFEAWVRDETSGRPIGRAPAFDPALASAENGLVAAFSDNRYANTEVLLASLACGEGP